MVKFDYYCRNCRKYFKRIDVKQVRIQDGGGNICFCMKCDSKLLFHSGYRLKFCSICGCSFPLLNMLSYKNNGDYSNRKIRAVLHATLTHKKLPYELKVPLFDEIKQTCKTNYEIIDFIVKKAHATQRFVIDNFIK